MRAIEKITGLTVTGIVNNTHLLRETTAGTVLRGHALCADYCEKTGKTLWCDCYPERIVDEDALSGIKKPPHAAGPLHEADLA